MKRIISFGAILGCALAALFASSAFATSTTISANPDSAD